MSKDLQKWEICDPQNAQDILPMPYRLIDQVIKETILYKLEMSMFQIQEKKKNQNYEGKVPEYLANSTIDIEQVCCLSSKSKFQNYLVAGDRNGQLLVIDMPKKTLFCRKQIQPSKRVAYITQSTVTDGETYITTVAVILHNSHKVSILRYKHNQPKISLTAEVEITQENSDITNYPIQCQFLDQGRLLIIKNYEGTIFGFAIPQIRLDIEKVKAQQNMNDNISNASNSIKKPIIYPLEYAALQYKSQTIKKPIFSFKFNGLQKTLNYKDLMGKLKSRGKVQQNKQPDNNNKKDAKKDPKKAASTQVQSNVPKVQVSLQTNQAITQRQQSLIINGGDHSQPYKKPKFYPFCYGIECEVEHPRKKSFEKSKKMKLTKSLIYGWINSKQFFSVNISEAKYQNLPYYMHFLWNQQLLTQQAIAEKQKQYSQSFKLQNSIKQKSVYAITSSCISDPDQLYLALGLQNGTISVWNTQTITLDYNTDKHNSAVTKLAFFETWKLISGSLNGEVHIDNIIDNKKEVKRSHVFQGTQNLEISDLIVNDIGIAYVMDIGGNMRVYDLWRNEKISRINSCNNFAIVQKKAKRWIPINHFLPTSSMYSNRDFSVFLSINWPSLPTSKVDQVPKQTIQKIQTLRKNPWKSKDISIHVVRNFEFLLNHFDGMQNVYKKGYEKGKIINLFSNLQFSQLYDRNFDIPDFGHTMQQSATHKTDLNKSNLSNKSKFTKQRKDKKQEENQKRAKLTNQVLHPEKFLLERRKIERNQAPTNEKLIQTIRQQHKKKDRRVNLLQSDLNKTGL